MTVYLRADWGSTGERGGYDLPGPVSEAYEIMKVVVRADIA